MTDLKTEEITYAAGGVDLKGSLVWDQDVEGPRPGIIVVHEWWGNNDYVRKRAEMLAELGYTALAIDMFGDGKTADNPNDAGALMNSVLDDMEAGRARFEAGLAQLKSHAAVDSSKTGAIGYCLGGGVVVHMARMGSDLDAVASFHGSLGLARAPGVDRMHTRVVAYHGEADALVSGEDIEAFIEEMENAGASYQLVQLPGALHGFSNPAATQNGEKFGLPLRYNALADQASWAHMQLLFEDVFAD